MLLNQLHQRDVFLVILVDASLHLIAQGLPLLAHLVLDVGAYLQLVLAPLAEPEVNGSQCLVDHTAHLGLVAEQTLQVQVVNTGIYHLQQVLQIAGVHILCQMFQLLASERAHLVPHRFGLLQPVADLYQFVAIFNLFHFLREQLGVGRRVVEQHFLHIRHYLPHFVRRYQHRFGHRLPLLASAELVQLAGVGIVNLVEIVLYVGKIHHIAELHLLVRAVHTGQRLQQVVVFQFTA